MPKRHVSEEWELGAKGHNGYDFIDANLNGDTKLFIDPCLIEISTHEIAELCTNTINSFFDRFFSIYRDGSRTQKIEILSHAREENSTHLGYGHPGKGKSAGNLLARFRPLETLIQEIPTISLGHDLPVLINGFAEDGMSDMLTNILHQPLNNYTINRLATYGRIPDSTTAFFSWNAVSNSWVLHEHQPCFSYRGKPVMLVPKQFVRKGYLFSTSQYLERVIVERIRQAGQGFYETNKPIPKDEYLKHHMRHNSEHWKYENAIEYSVAHPDALLEYHDRLPDFYRNARQLTDDDLDRYVY